MAHHINHSALHIGKATSPAIRRALAAHPRLHTLLRRIDALRGVQREAALEHVLGVQRTNAGALSVDGAPEGDVDTEDMRALRALAEAVEGAVRGDRREALGLDWEGMAEV